MTLVVLSPDGPEGQAAVQWAVAHRSEPAEHLHVVFARSDSPIRSGFVAHSTAERTETTLAGSAVEHSLYRDAEEPSVLALDLAERHGARLVVVGVKGRSQTLKFVMGSHVQHVLRASTMPVVCVKPTETGTAPS